MRRHSPWGTVQVPVTVPCWQKWSGDSSALRDVTLSQCRLYMGFLSQCTQLCRLIIHNIRAYRDARHQLSVSAASREIFNTENYCKVLFCLPLSPFCVFTPYFFKIHINIIPHLRMCISLTSRCIIRLDVSGSASESCYLADLIMAQHLGSSAT